MTTSGIPHLGLQSWLSKHNYQKLLLKAPLIPMATFTKGMYGGYNILLIFIDIINLILVNHHNKEESKSNSVIKSNRNNFLPG